jgi:hypothetical protein
MFFDSKFSILKAYLTSLKINLEYIAFYLFWELVVLAITIAFMIYLAISMDILDPAMLKENYTWIFHYISKLFTDISIQKMVETVTITGHEPYDIFKIILSENILNHTLENISWSEYFKVILIPKKAILFISIFFISIIFMTISVGYIKTALKFQSGQKASIHDLYQSFYLVPPYFSAKLIIFSIFLIPAIPFLWKASFLDVLNIFSIVFFTCLAVFLYQRLRFIQYFIIDKEISVGTACMSSWKLTHGSVFHLCIYSIVGMLFFTHPGSGLLIVLFMLIYKQADVNIYKQMTA